MCIDAVTSALEGQSPTRHAHTCTRALFLVSLNTCPIGGRCVLFTCYVYPYLPSVPLFTIAYHGVLFVYTCVQVCEGFLKLVVPKLKAREDIVVESYVRQRMIESLDLRLLVSTPVLGALYLALRDLLTTDSNWSIIPLYIVIVGFN